MSSAATCRHAPPWAAIRARCECNYAHLWEFVDEPLVNAHFESIEDLEKVVSGRCVELIAQRDAIRADTLFHWWPEPGKAN